MLNHLKEQRSFQKDYDNFISFYIPIVETYFSVIRRLTEACSVCVSDRDSGKLLLDLDLQIKM